MTVIGADRPGLVGQLARVIADHGGNWLESRMAHLGGQFAGILRVEVPSDHEAKLLDALRALQSTGLSVSAHRGAPRTAEPVHRQCTVELVGHDRPGIVRQISEVLAQHQINVEELTTDCESAPMSGEMLFHAVARVRLPAAYQIGELRQALEQIAGDLMVDLTIKPDSEA